MKLVEILEAVSQDSFESEKVLYSGDGIWRVVISDGRVELSWGDRTQIWEREKLISPQPS